MKIQKISPFLWFAAQAEEAVELYVSLFEDSKVVSRTVVDEANNMLMLEFVLAGSTYYALDGGPLFHFTPAISLFVHCETQEEVDRLWDALSQGGETQPCGWLKDKYGLSWQIVPNALKELMTQSDEEKAKRVMQALMTMSKIDIEGLKNA